MALRDRFDKIVSYFDTEDVSELEEGQGQFQQRPAHQERTQQPEQKVAPVRQSQQREPQQAPVRREQVGQGVSPSVSATKTSRPTPPIPPVPQPSRPAQQQPLPSQGYASRTAAPSQPAPGNEPTRIALKYPRRYEDAPAIVDLLIQNECVLIDFEYMLEAQARRCLDFIDGASKVLYGSLQKVGASMYLLAPANVVVDIEEIINPNSGQDINFDYDMKRR